MAEPKGLKEWRRGAATRGPLALPRAEVALSRLVTARSLCSAAPAGEAPLVLLCEVDGTPLYLHTTSGKIVSLHHDASLSEAAEEAAAATRTPAEFARALVERGSGVALEALLSLARAVEGWKTWRPRGMPPAERAKVICEGLGVTPRKLASKVRSAPVVFEWLGLEAATLEALADGVPARVVAAPKAAVTSSLPVVRVVDSLAGAKASDRALDVKTRLTKADLRQLGRLEGLETLVVRLEPGATVPPTLARLRALTVFGGGEVPAFPALERLTAWAPATLPRSLPMLVELGWQPTDETLTAGLRAIAGYRALRKLVLFNAWPTAKTVPPALLKLSQLTSLQLVNTAWGRDVAGCTRLRKALAACDVQVT